MNESELHDLIEEIMNDVDGLSPYRLSKVCSELVKYEVLPQVIYSYCRQGFIKFTMNSLNHKEVSHDECVRFLKKYVVRNYMKK